MILPLVTASPPLGHKAADLADNLTMALFDRAAAKPAVCVVFRLVEGLEVARAIGYSSVQPFVFGTFTHPTIPLEIYLNYKVGDDS
jgi:hypothetical protein